MKKKLIHFLQQFDGIWSVPLAFGLFWIFGLVLTSLFGGAVGLYDPGFLQPLFLSGAVVVGANAFALVGLYFNWRGFFRFLYGAKNQDGNYVNKAKQEWLRLSPVHKFSFSLFMYLFYMVCVLIVYLKLV